MRARSPPASRCMAARCISLPAISTAARSSSRRRFPCEPESAPSSSPRGYSSRSMSSTHGRCAGFSRTALSSSMGWCELKEMMRNWFWLVLSVALVARAEPPAQLEIVFTLKRNGSPMAEVVERLEYAKGNYKLTETWKGRGMYALLGTARRVSQGSLADGALRPREFFDERSGRDTARAWFDWKA